jgi:hypothetical protein
MKRFNLVATVVVAAVLFASGTAFGGSKTVTLLPCTSDPRYENGSGVLKTTSYPGQIQLPGGAWIRGLDYRIQYAFQGLPEGYYELGWASSRGGLTGTPRVIYIGPDGTASGTIWPVFSENRLDYYWLRRVTWSDVFGSWQYADPYSALCN